MAGQTRWQRSIWVLVGAMVLLTANGTAYGASTSASGGTAPRVRPLDVLNAPTKVAKTATGPVGYREVGAGSPIVLVMGLGGSMDDWQPAFVASLAAHHTVLVFDNAGVGDTASLASPLSITEMADQTSALLSTLRLGRVAVLGWSMGGMIAQALAVLHRAQVSKLVLAATQPGTGHALPIPPAAGTAAASTNPAAVLSVLFPPDQSAAAGVYVAGILRYPNFYQAPRTTTAAQVQAVEQWMAGQDQAGTQFDHARLPTLVADGTLDELDPSANDRSLAASVPGAKLFLYAGAGHAFLFQDSASFLPAVQRFLR